MYNTHEKMMTHETGAGRRSKSEKRKNNTPAKRNEVNAHHSQS
jgi:hypothetical protein